MTNNNEMPGMPRLSNSQKPQTPKKGDQQDECKRSSASVLHHRLTSKPRTRLESLRKSDGLSWKDSWDSSSSNNSDAEDECEGRSIGEEVENDDSSTKPRMLPCSPAATDAGSPSVQSYRIRKDFHSFTPFSPVHGDCESENIDPVIDDGNNVRESGSDHNYPPPHPFSMDLDSLFFRFAGQQRQQQTDGQHHVRRHSLPTPSSKNIPDSASAPPIISPPEIKPPMAPTASPSLSRFRSISFGYPIVPALPSPRQPPSPSVKRMQLSTMRMSGPIGRSLRSSASVSSDKVAERPIEEVIPNFEYLHFSLLRHTLRREVAPDELLSRDDCLAVMNSKLSYVVLQEADTSFAFSTTPYMPPYQRNFLCEMHTTAAEQLQHINREMKKLRQHAHLRPRQMKVLHKLKSGDLDFMAVPRVTENEILLEETFSTCSPQDRDSFAPAVVAVVKSKTKSNSDCGSTSMVDTDIEREIEKDEIQMVLTSQNMISPKSEISTSVSQVSEVSLNDNIKPKKAQLDDGSQTQSTESASELSNMVYSNIVALENNFAGVTAKNASDPDRCCACATSQPEDEDILMQGFNHDSTLLVSKSTSRLMTCSECAPSSKKIKRCDASIGSRVRAFSGLDDGVKSEVDNTVFYEVVSETNAIIIEENLSSKNISLNLLCAVGFAGDEGEEHRAGESMGQLDGSKLGAASCTGDDGEKHSGNGSTGQLHYSLLGTAGGTGGDGDRSTGQLDFSLLGTAGCTDDEEVLHRDGSIALLDSSPVTISKCEGNTAELLPVLDPIANFSLEPVAIEVECVDAIIASVKPAGSSPRPQDDEPFPEEPPSIGRVTQLSLDSIIPAGGSLTSCPYLDSETASRIANMSIGSADSVTRLNNLWLKRQHSKYNNSPSDSERNHKRITQDRYQIEHHQESHIPIQKSSTTIRDSSSPDVDSSPQESLTQNIVELSNEKHTENDGPLSVESHFNPLEASFIEIAPEHGEILNANNDDIMMSCSFPSPLSHGGHLVRHDGKTYVGEILSQHQLSLMSLSPKCDNDLSIFSSALTEGSDSAVSYPHVSEHYTPSRFRRRLEHAVSVKRNAENALMEGSISPFFPSKTEVSPATEEVFRSTSSSISSGVPPPHMIRRKLLLPDLSDVLTGEDMTDVDLLDNYMYCNHNQDLNKFPATSRQGDGNEGNSTSAVTESIKLGKTDPLQESIAVSITMSGSAQSTFSQRSQSNPGKAFASEDDFEHPFAKSSRSLGFIGLVNSAAVDNFCESSSLQGGDFCNINVISSSCNSIGDAVEIVMGLLPSADDVSGHCGSENERHIQGASCKDALLACWNDVHATSTTVCNINVNRAPCGPTVMYRQTSAKNKCRVHGQLFSPPTLKLRSQSLTSLPEDEISRINTYEAFPSRICRLNNNAEDYSYMNPRWAMAVRGSDGSPYPEPGYGRPPPIPTASNDFPHEGSFEGRHHPGLPIARKYFSSSERTSHQNVSRHLFRPERNMPLKSNDIPKTPLLDENVRGHESFFGCTYNEDRLFPPSQTNSY